MIESAENPPSRRIPAPSSWLAILALLAACGSDSPPAEDLACASAPTGCPCADGTTNCSPATASPSPDAGLPPTSGFPATAGDADAAGPDATTAPLVDAGGGAISAAPDAAIDAGAPPGLDAGSDGSLGDASPAGEDAATEAGAPGGAVGFVGEHGALHVQGNRVVDRNGQAVQLRGMSWFWSQWSDFYVAENVDVLVDDWKATLIRAALGVENDGGYLQDPQGNVNKVRTLVDRAIERGIYVLIDWHDHHAQDHATQANAFFKAMAESYGDQPNVIFEVYNEPMDVAWPTVKSYAEQVIRTIRQAGSSNLIIVGTPTWSQDVDIAANDRITSDDNVAYTLHFYANTHKQPLRDKATTALDRGIALFVTEWGTCSADGNGSINEGETRTWLSYLKDHSISWANWALNNKAEACSAVVPSGASKGPWRDDQLTPSGRLVKNAIP